MPFLALPRPRLLPLLRTTATGLVALAALAWAPDARAGIDACGDIHLEADAECEVLVEGGCVAQCTPPRLEAACAAELYTNCDAECSELPSLQCTGSCQAGCDAECEVNPGAFDCRAACNADCQGQCDARCASGDSECRASCEATCSGECEASCDVVPPSGSCEARCEAACMGSCEANTNLDCQVDCQADGFIECKADLEGGCEVACQRPDGALFCDGQYVDHGGNLEECIGALRALYDIEVDGYAGGGGEGGGGGGGGGGSISCSVGRGEAGPRGRMGPVVLGVMVVLIGVARRGRVD